MSKGIAEPFTPEEMKAIRRAAREANSDEVFVRHNFWSALKRVARHVPFSQDLVAAYYCALDPATPLRVRVILLGALGYFILPVDAIADFLPVVGFTDDAAVLAMAIATVSSSITLQHRQRAQAMLDDDPVAGEPG